MRHAPGVFAAFLNWRALLALLAGLAQAASLAWPSVLPGWLERALQLMPGQPVWWLQLLALGALAWLLSDCQARQPQAWRQAAGLAGLFALAWLAGAFGWIYVALHTYGQLNAWLAALAALVLPALLALYYALAAALWLLCAPTHKAAQALLFAAFWALAELMRAQLFSGFAWGAVGYAHTAGPLAAYAPWVGVYGLCAISAWLAMTLAHGVQATAWRQRFVCAGWLAGVLGLAGLGQLFAPSFTAASGNLSVTLLQGNIPQDEKFAPDSGVALALRWYAEQFNASQTELVIAPETAIPLLPQALPPAYWQALRDRFSQGEQAALLGVPMGDMQTGYTNSVVGFKPGSTWRYDKHQLVPFGEFIPPWFKWFTNLLSIPLSDFNQGARGQALFDWRGQKIAANICFESLFSEQLAAAFSHTAQAPTLFVNVSNLAWFGHSLAMEQHLQIARMRALEFERAFVLATNTGLSAMVNAQGQVIALAPRDVRTTLVGVVQGRVGRTPYAWWSSQWGLWPLQGAALAVIAASLWWRWRQRA